MYIPFHCRGIFCIFFKYSTTMKIPRQCKLQYVSSKCFNYNDIKKFFNEKYNFITTEIYMGTLYVIKKLDFPEKHIEH